MNVTFKQEKVFITNDCGSCSKEVTSYKPKGCNKDLAT